MAWGLRFRHRGFGEKQQQEEFTMISICLRTDLKDMEIT
jgi:hypothetical protein